MTKHFSEPSERNKNKKALVLIQGTGAVRAGLWARSATINDNFEIGTMLPQIKWAIDHKFAVLVMNPNHGADGSNMQTHACDVWNKYVKNSGFTNIYIIAHSAGGGCMSSIIEDFADTFMDQVSKIAYTDSWVIERQDFMSMNAIHYEASNHPLNTLL